jgi:hypothetical protein
MNTGEKRQEKIFFEDKEIRITDEFFFVGGRSFEVKKITMVEKRKKPAKGGVAMVLLATGVSLLFLSDSKIAGSVLIALALMVVLTFRKKFLVVITMDEEEKEVYSSVHEEGINKVIEKLNEAITFKKSE